MPKMSTYLQIENNQLSVSVFGNDFVLLRPHRLEIPLHHIAEAIYKNKPAFVDEVIGTEVEICLKVNEHFSVKKLSKLEDFKFESKLANSAYKLPICFDEENDWKIIEEHSKLSRVSYKSKLMESKLSIAMFGFLPGFLYLSGIKEELIVPRKNTPSKRVEAGSIAIGSKYIGFYSLPSPGGWNIIGRSPISILNLESIPVLDLKVGDTITLQSISKKNYQALQNNPLTIKEYNELL